MSLFALEAKAGLQVPIPLAEDAKAKVTLGCCFESMPPRGYAPIWVTINNFSGASREWTFRFSGLNYYSAGNNVNLSSKAAVTVENNATRTIPLLVPLGTGHDGGSVMLRVAVEGYGTGSGVTQMFGRGTSSSGHPITRFVVVSNSLGTGMWSQLGSLLTGHAKELNGSLVDPGALPGDWRGLAGVYAIWLSEGEVNQLSLAQRSALRTWVQMGGLLKICGAASIPADFQVAGFGSAETAEARLEAAEVDKTLSSLREAPADMLLSMQPASTGLDPVAPNVPGLLAFMALFALVVGPVNIFVLAGSRRRQRLFWTTPLISVGASAILIAFILLQDGVGGNGERDAFVYVVPLEHKEIVLQYQRSRTGLLLGSSFQTADAVFIEQAPPSGYSVPGKTRNLENDGATFTGDWFTSRSLQVQQIASVVSTRGEIAVVNAPEMRDHNAAPVILSTFSVPFEKLIYTDAQHRQWTGQNVQAGQKQTLTAGSGGSNSPGSGTPMRDEPETFAATSRDSSVLAGTLPSIHWRDRPVTYLGPVTFP